MSSINKGLRPSRKKSLSIVIGAVAVILALAGCSTGSTSSGSGSSIDTASLKKTIAQYEANPQFTPAGAAFDAQKAMKGKSILSIPGSSANPAAEAGIAGMKAVAKALGFKFQEYTNQGSVSEWQQGMEYGIQQHFSLIDLWGGTDPRQLTTQIAQAKAAGIKVVVSHASAEGQKVDVPGLTGALEGPFEQVARILADWVTLQSKGKAEILVIESKEVLATDPMVAAMQDEFKKVCGSGCVVHVQNVPIASWSTQVQSTVAAALVSYPNLNYVVPTFDSATQFITPAIQAAGKTGKVKIATFNGTPFVLDEVRSGKVQMDVGENQAWIGAAIMDTEMRVLAGLPFVASEHTALRIFTSANVKEAGVPVTLSGGYGNAYKVGYSKLWNLTGAAKAAFMAG